MLFLNRWPYSHTRNCLFHSDIIRMAQCMGFFFGTIINIGANGVGRWSLKLIGRTITHETAYFILTNFEWLSAWVLFFGTFINNGANGVSRRSSDTIGHTVTPESAYFFLTQFEWPSAWVFGTFINIGAIEVSSSSLKLVGRTITHETACAFLTYLVWPSARLCSSEHSPKLVQLESANGLPNVLVVHSHMKLPISF